MRRTYNVFDCILGEYIMKDALPSAIQKKIGIKNKMVCQYETLRMKFHQQYQFEICREWGEASTSPFISVYDLKTGDYVMAEASAKEISEKYGLLENTVENYASLCKAIRGTYLLFRSDRVPVKKLITEDLIESWETITNSLNPKRKERQAG